MKKASKIAFVAMMGLLLFGCSKKNNKDKTKDTTNVTTKVERKATLIYSAGEGATIPGSKLGAEVIYGKSFTLDVPTKKGSTFKGWYIREGITRIDLTDASGKSLKNFDYEFSGSELTIYADWTTEVETVTFNSCGGTNVNAQEVEYGSYASRPDTNPTRDGYTFDDWYTKEVGGEKWTFTSTQVLADTTIYAHWTPKQYALDFDTDDDSMGTVSCSITDAVVDCGTSFTLTATEKEGYTFDRWYYYKDADLSTRIPLDNGTSKTVTLTMPAYDVSYLAVWTTCELTTQKVGDGIISVYDTANITAGKTVELVAKPATGYTFAGWYYGEEQEVAPSDCTYDSESGSYTYAYVMPKASLTLTAKFVINTHTITIDKTILRTTTEKYGTISQSGNGTYEYGGSVTLTASAEDGYTFLGWYGSSDTLVTPQESFTFNVEDRDYAFTAKFTYYTVTTLVSSDCSDRGTINETYNNVKVTVGDLIYLEATPKTWNQFNGWYDQNDELAFASSELFFEMSAEDLYLCAKFGLIEYTITYDLDATDATNNEGNKAKFTTEDIPLVLLDPSRVGYTFSGWVDATTNQPITEINENNFGSKSIKATWTAKTYKIYFYNGISGVEGSNQGVYDIYLGGVADGTSDTTCNITYDSQVKLKFRPYAGRQVQSILFYIGNELVETLVDDYDSTADYTFTSKLINETTQNASIRVIFEAVEEMKYFTFMAGKVQYEKTYNCKITGANPEYVNASGYVDITELTIPNYVDGFSYGSLAKFTMLKTLSTPIIGLMGDGTTTGKSQMYVFSYVFGSQELYNTVKSVYVYNVENNNTSTAYLPKDLEVVKITNMDIIPCCAFAFISGCPTNFKVVELYPTAVGDYAFYGSNIAGNYVPSNGEYVYSVGSYATYIGKYAFANDTALTYFHYSLTGDSITDIKKITIGKCAFAGCKNLNYLQVPFVGESANFDTSSTDFNIKYSFFYWFGESSDSKVQNKSDMYAWIAWDDNVYYVPKTIGSAKFNIDFVSFCGIAFGAFAYKGPDTAGSTSAPLLEIYFENAAYNGNTTCYKIGNYAFYKVPRVRFYEYSGNVQLYCVNEIGERAFQNAGLHNSPFSRYSHDVVTIGDYAFFNAFSTVTSGVDIILPDTVKTIRQCAFAGSHNKINRFVFNKGLTSISNIFKGDDTNCADVGNVYFYGTQTEYESSTVKSSVITWNIGLTKIYKYDGLYEFTTTVIATL
ncbi:MAG: InlB B-repeat-containing protein [Acholeplasmatales bacterium]|nr:InlB B-repeat-containing protein [Acholeplasmatales bacterium]